VDTYFSTTVATTIPEAVTPTASGYADVTLTATSDSELLLRASAPVFGPADKGKIVWCQNELRTIQSVQNAFEILVSPAFTTAPNATLFKLVTPRSTKFSLTCTVNSFLCTPDGVESTFIANTTVGVTALAVAIRPAGGATIAGTYNP
jgi:hypothetical protein